MEGNERKAEQSAKEAALRSYMDAQDLADRILYAIKTKYRELDRAEDVRDWGHAGNANRLVSKLKEILEEACE